MNNVLVNVVSSSKKRKATIINVDGKLFGITKECMPKEEFVEIFPDRTISNWKFVARDRVIETQGVKKHLHKLSRSTTNWNVRQLN